MNIGQLFEALPQNFNRAAAEGMTKTLQWKITGDDPGVWAFEIIDGNGRIIPGGVEKPDAIFTVSGKDWIAIAEGKMDSMRAFMTGKLKVSGDMSLALKVPEFFPTSITAQ